MEKKVEEHRFSIPKTVRYCTASPDSDPIFCLVVLHGYRQLAKYFIKHFLPLTEYGAMVVAPEGLHRFYLDGYHGKVGASWMTKEARLDDIADYTHYLSSLLKSLPINNIPVVLLGFSQGGATACRFVASSNVHFAGLILHGSVFPDDFDFSSQQNLLEQLRVFTIFGDSDQFAPEEVIAEKMTWLRSHGLEPSMYRFVGGHEIHLDSVIKVLKSLKLV